MAFQKQITRAKSSCWLGDAHAELTTHPSAQLRFQQTKGLSVTIERISKSCLLGQFEPKGTQSMCAQTNL